MSRFVTRHSFYKLRCLGINRIRKDIVITRGRFQSSNSAALSVHLKRTIEASGRLTVARYMEEALTNPKWGYYMHRDVFGKEGDFTTSPEVSQMFGELIGIWFISQWMAFGKPTNVQLVELGPGRGTLMTDILRVFSQFAGISQCITVHLIDVSPHLISMQQNTLCTPASVKEASTTASNCYLTHHGVKINWHPSFADIPPGLSFIVAHEFFDALPVHLFKKTERGWRELLVDHERDEMFQFVTASGRSPLITAFPPPNVDSTEYEVSPLSFRIMDQLSSHIAAHGGCGLIIDYGEDGSHRHSLRAFKNHQLHNVLAGPGSADITANVDFSLLRHAACSASLDTFGPVTQGDFLHRMGIESRLQALLKNATEKQTSDLKSSYHFLTGASSMGDKFKMFSFGQSNMELPPGFL